MIEILLSWYLLGYVCWLIVMFVNDGGFDRTGLTAGVYISIGGPFVLFFIIVGIIQRYRDYKRYREYFRGH